MSSVPACLLSTLPVVHPPHLEGDASLATEILPGPPSLESIRQLAKRNEPRKFPVPSYLPRSDPGTTYTSLTGGMAALALDEIGPRRKRARMDKGVSNRAQRASARHLTGNTALIDSTMVMEADAAPFQPSMDDATVFNEEDRSTSHSRSTSVPLSGETHTHYVLENGLRITNGKGKEKEHSEKGAQVRVKEEPVTLQLSDVLSAPTNEDHCSSCSSVGALVYCDGCPRAFHLWCLDPPMDPSDFPEGEESWFCPGCKADRGPLSKPSHTFLSPLLQQLQNTIPTEFRLPEEIRTFFRDVGTGLGGVYIDNSSIRANRIGRHGLGEERDPYRLKDSKGVPVICFRCGKSALPDEPATGHFMTRTRRTSTISSQSKHWKALISCDFCPLHWHVDCLNPPLASLPPINRKWKCPNHASGSVRKMRTPRTTAPPIDITETRQRNNGNIEIIDSEIARRSEEKMSVDEVLINGRKYRVPERIIVLDFWSKIRQQRSSKSESMSAASSPLTSLSSLDDLSDQAPRALSLNDRLGDEDTLRVAEMLCQLQSRGSGAKVQPSTVEKGARAERHDLVRLIRHDREHDNTRSVANVAKHETHRKEQTYPDRSFASSASSKSRSKNGMNGVRSSRPKRTSSSNSTSHPGQKTSETIPSGPGIHLRHGPRIKQSASSVNGSRDTGSDDMKARSITNATNEGTELKQSLPSLKIRIPSRLLQKQLSNNSTSTGETARAPSSISALQARPRRSHRRHASLNRTGSDRSISIDHGQDGCT